MGVETTLWMTYVYRDSSVLVKWLLALLAIGALLHLVGVLSSLSEYSILQQLARGDGLADGQVEGSCLLYTSPSPRD